MNLNSNETITTIELREIVNQARILAGENPVENSHFVRRVEDELEGELGCALTSIHPQNGVSPMLYYNITFSQAVRIVSRESKAIRKAVLPRIVDKVQGFEALMEALKNIDLDFPTPHQLYVYVAQNEMTGNVKIGISRDPVRRVKQLQVGCDGVLSIVFTQPANSFAEETRLHHQYASENVQGEWFSGGVLENILAGELQ